MTTFSPGSMEAFYHDLEIPVKYGIRLPVSMTVGPPGVSAALRTVPVAYEIVKEMETLCPNAYLLNVTNPMSAVTRAMNLAARSVRILGLCHEFHCFPGLLEPILDLQKPEHQPPLEYLYKGLSDLGFDYTVAGLNHFIWITQATLDGEDALPAIRDFAHKNRDLKPDGAPYHAFQNHHAVKLALCRTFGYLPTVGDRHLVEFWPSLCNPRNGYGMAYDVSKTTVDSRVHRVDRSLAAIHRIARGEEEVDWTRSAEEMSDIIEALLTHTEMTCILNLPNQGQITNLPQDTIVETLATISPEAITPKPSGDLPGPIGSLCRLHADVHELTVQAALNGDRDLCVQAFSLDPSSAGADFSELGILTDELLLANKKWLPRFFQ
jgi:alpha-galactosidase